LLKKRDIDYQNFVKDYFLHSHPFLKAIILLKKRDIYYQNFVKDYFLHSYPFLKRYIIKKRVFKRQKTLTI